MDDPSKRRGDPYDEPDETGSNSNGIKRLNELESNANDGFSGGGDPVYDHPGNQSSQADNKDRSSAKEADNDDESSFYRPAEASTKGRSGIASSTGQTAAGSPKAAAALGQQKLSPQAIQLSMLRNRKVIGGGGLVGLIIAAVFGFSIFQGPLQLIHLSQVLQYSFSKNNSDTSNRMSKLFKYARAAKNNDLGETRVGILGSRVFGKTMTQMEELGITVERGPTGVPLKTQIDTDKLKANYPEVEGMSKEEKISFLSDKLGVPSESIKGSGSLFSIDQSKMSIKEARLLTKSSVALLGDGKIASAIKFRVITKFFNLPSLLHPLKRSVADKENKAATAAEKKLADKKARQQAIADETQPIEAAAEDAANNVKGSKFNKGLTSALLLTGGACLAYTTADDIVTINRDAVVLPSAIRASDAIAVGAQIQSGQDMGLNQVGASLSNLSDSKGKTVWDGQALHALTNGGQSEPSMADMPTDYKQAYLDNSNSAKIRDGIDHFFKSTTGLGAGGTFGVCGKIGTATQIIIGTTLALGSAFGEVASGGSITPFIAGGIVAKEAINMAVAGAALHYIHQYVIGKETVKLAEDAFSGPSGGNLLAYGSRAAANTAAVASGGIDLGNKNTTKLGAADIEDQHRFENSSVANKLFNTHDYRSLASKVIDNTSSSPISNLNKVASLFTNFGSLFKNNLSGLIIPKAHAAEDKRYSWGFSQYGLPDDMLNDPSLSDPYANANEVAALLDSGDTPYIERANTCFGVDISKGSGAWDVTPLKDVNTASSDYNPDDCASTDPSWRRIVMFVFDSSTMKAAACYEGDDESCQSFQPASASTPTPTPAPADGGSAPTGNAQDLAKQLKPYINSGQISCRPLSTFDAGCSDITNTASGKSIKGGEGCQVDALNPVLLGMLLKLAQMNHKFVLSALCSDHHDDGLNAHAGGKAADFNVIDGQFMGPSATESWSSEKISVATKLDQDIASFMPKTTGFGQQQCHPAFSFLTGFNLFNDGCHHQHVQVAG